MNLLRMLFDLHRYPANSDAARVQAAALAILGASLYGLAHWLFV